MLVEINDPIDDMNEKIHTVLSAKCSSDSINVPVRQGGNWGCYPFKPTCQTQWDQSVKEAVAKVDSAEPSKSDLRPRVMDNNSGLSILLDTGASVSIWPKNWRHFKNLPHDPNKNLQAVNGNRIRTFGTHSVKIQPPYTKSPYWVEVIVAEISEPILGWNWIVANKLDLRWNRKKCTLVDSIRGQTIPLRMEVANANNLGLALLSFRQYSQERSEKASKFEPKQVIPQAYQQLLDSHPDILKVNFLDKPKHGIIHDIPTGTNKPCRASVRPIAHGTQKAKESEATWKELERLGVIEKVKAGEPTLWSSPLHLAKKADGTWRPCGDYRALNAITDHDSFPLPNLRHEAPKIKGSTIFSSIDLFRAFYNIELSESAAQKTTLVSPWGTYKFKRLSMGLKNSAQSFQRFMSVVLEGLQGVFCYLDDILVYSTSEEKHFKTLDAVFNRLSENGLTINLKKCQFGKSDLTFLGYKLDGVGLVPLPKKLSAIADYPPPQKPKQLLGFLGAINYYRRLLPKVDGQSPASILQPLYHWATRKAPGKKFCDIWKEENLQKNFDLAKKMLLLACQVIHPDPNRPLALTTDASITSIGGTLEEFDGENWLPIGFWSESLKPAQQRWSTFRRELLAVKNGIRHFISEIDGRKLTVFSDHLPLLGAFKSQDSMRHDPIAKNHLMEISYWTSEIKHVSGRKNFVADALSRIETHPCIKPSTAEVLFHADAVTRSKSNASPDAARIETVDHQQLAIDQQSCQEVALHRTGQHTPGLVLKDVEFTPGVFLLCDTATKRPRPIVPKSHRSSILSMLHGIDHPGVKETVKRVSDRYFWPKMRTEITDFVNQCVPCNRSKAKKTVVPPLDPKPVLKPRFKELSVDVVGPLVEREGMKYLFTCVDRTSRYMTAIPMPEATARNCRNAFVDGWISMFGLPSTVHCDNAGTFTSRLWKEIHQQLDTIISYTPIYSPQSLGSIERQHGPLKTGLRATLLAMGDEFQTGWMRVLPYVLLGRRNSYHSDLGASPAEVVFGEQMKLPGDAPLPMNAGETMEELLARVKALPDRPPAQTNLHKTVHPYMPSKCATTTHVYTERAKKTPLEPRYDGPFPILQRLGKSCLQIEVGRYVSGQPRTEVRHWNTCSPADVAPSTENAIRPTLGRKPLNPKAKTFEPKSATS